MKRIVYFGLIVISLVVLSSCSTTYRVSSNMSVIDSLVGVSRAGVIQTLGSPTTITDFEGGYVMNFENNDYVFKYDRTQGLNPRLEVFMNSDDVCYSTRVCNDTPVKKHSPGKTTALICGIIAALFII